MTAVMPGKVYKVMSGIPAERQNLADRLDNVLRRFEREGGDIHRLASDVGHEARDLRRWAGGTTMPAEVLVALLGELPRHLADLLIGATSLRLVRREDGEKANALRAAASTSAFAADVASRFADGEWCHRDDAATREHAQELITVLQPLAGE